MSGVVWKLKTVSFISFLHVWQCTYYNTSSQFSSTLNEPTVVVLNWPACFTKSRQKVEILYIVVPWHHLSSVLIKKIILKVDNFTSKWNSSKTKKQKNISFSTSLSLIFLHIWLFYKWIKLHIIYYIYISNYIYYVTVTGVIAVLYLLLTSLQYNNMILLL